MEFFVNKIALEILKYLESMYSQWQEAFIIEIFVIIYLPAFSLELLLVDFARKPNKYYHR